MQPYAFCDFLDFKINWRLTLEYLLKLYSYYSDIQLYYYEYASQITVQLGSHRNFRLV